MSVDGRLVNDAVGETVVRMPDAPRDTESGDDAAAAGPRNRHQSPSPPDANEPSSPAAGSAEDNDTDGVEDYLRRTVEAQQQNTDGEITA
jgi:hypothetical protein